MDRDIEAMFRRLTAEVNNQLEQLADNLGVYRSTIIIWNQWNGASTWTKRDWRRAGMSILQIMSEDLNEEIDKEVMAELIRGAAA